MAGMTQRTRGLEAKRKNRRNQRKAPNTMEKLRKFDYHSEVNDDCIREARTFSRVAIVGSQQFDEQQISRLANALSQNIGLEELVISNSQMDSACLTRIVHAMGSCENLKKVDFGCNTITRGEYEGCDAGGHANYDIDYEGLETLEKWIKENIYFRWLNLCKNNLNATQLEGTFQTLLKHPGIRHLDISCNKLGIKGSIMLAKFIQMNRAIRSLDVRSCQMKDLGMQMLSNPLAMNDQLQTLCLRGNSITDYGAGLISLALRKGAKRITELDLSVNSINSDGLVELAVAIRSPSLRMAVLKLDHNPLTNRGEDFAGIRKLCEALKINRALHTLTMANTGIVNRKIDKSMYSTVELEDKCLEGVRLIADCLPENTALQHIDLRGNAITTRYGRSLIAALNKMPTCIPTIQVVRRVLLIRSKQELKRHAKTCGHPYPRASARWLRIRVFRRVLPFLEEDREILGLGMEGFGTRDWGLK
eukprot:g2533.t1